MTNTSLRLEIIRVNQTCVFKLSWGKNQQLTATLNYPESLTTLYQDWQRAYLSYYRTQLRGRVENSGAIASLPIDWHAKLVHAEAAFLYEFRYWLRSAELNEINDEIVSAAAAFQQISTPSQPKYIDIFLTCNTPELERLPWENWKIGDRLGLSSAIRIVRTPVNIRHEVVPPLRRRPRILVILGDETDLDFKKEKAALKKLLSRIATIEFEGWQPGETSTELRQKIKNKIASEQGWDVLFFAGHSNETELTGGEIAIAPGVSLSISEIEPEILIAKQRGLQFALFNSCSGISIATSLINLGLSQVAIMREPIHNQVAQSFLVKFLENLATYKDIHESLIAAIYTLKEQNNYPSAYLVPSLFYHPQAVLFQIQPRGMKETIRKLLPTKYEAIALSSFLLLSLIPQLQHLLLDSRIWLQAIYRDVTHQIPVATSPPVLLVGIDEESLRSFSPKSFNPIDRSYLTQLVNKSIINAKVVGIDYLLDYQQKDHDFQLGKAIRDGVNKNIYFVFASQELGGKQIGVGEETNIADLNWSLQGDISSFDWYLEQPVSANYCLVKCPFSYLLSVAYGLNQQPTTSSLPQPNLANKQNLNTQIIKYIHQSNQPNNIIKLLSGESSHLAPITEFSHNFNQTWLQPLTDFSIPINQVYKFIPAWKFLKLSSSDIQRLKLEQRVVLIAPAGYQYAGVTKYDEDNFPVPMAINYWRERLKNTPPNSEVLTEVEVQLLENTPPNSQVLTGAEVHGYSIHHFLNQHLVRHIPDLWMVGLAALLGKVTVLIYHRNKERKQWVFGLAIATVGYGIISLQVYISAAILIPWLLPSAVFWVYFFRNEKK
ncbi:MAG TPA: CHASE2 domain-containing protein [Oculatellaceae cyanobacterium]|jgi:hypothetical protein